MTTIVQQASVVHGHCHRTMRHAKSSIIHTKVNYHAFESYCVPLSSEPVCFGVCVVVSLVLSLGFCEWTMHTPRYLVAQHFSIAIFSDQK